jgi:hypothetical protein
MKSLLTAFLFAALTVVLFVAPPQRPRRLLAAGSPVAEVADTTWYEPQEADFKAHYETDKANMSKQTFKDYFGWVKSFYAGNFLDSGWTKRGQELVSSVRKEETRAALRKKLNALGKTIAAEWAKANDARKVDTSKLIAWGTRLQDAKKNDQGDGAAISKEIETISKELTPKVAN